MSNPIALAHTIVPGKEDKYGPLPWLLLVLTMVTGVVDAVSFLKLGNVFVANMTGNVVFAGFAIAGVEAFWTPASVVAIAAFLAGALAAGRLGIVMANPFRHFTGATFIELVLVTMALAVSISAPHPDSEWVRYALIVLLALTMGVQNATARRLGIPNLTTTVLTLTLTGLAADSNLAGKTPQTSRGLAAVGAMFLGAVLGGALISSSGVGAALALALALLVVVGAAAYQQSSSCANREEQAKQAAPV